MSDRSTVKITRSGTRTAYLPDWISYEVHEALAAIKGEHVAKKETTILRLAHAVANKQPQASVWEHPDTCTSNVWHGRGGRPGWKHNPVIANAYRIAEARARWWKRVKMGQALEDASDDLVDLAPDAVRQLANVIRRGEMEFARAGDVVVKQASVGEVIKASVDVLDRAGVETAQKGSNEQSGAVNLVVEYVNRRED